MSLLNCKVDLIKQSDYIVKEGVYSKEIKEYSPELTEKYQDGIKLPMDGQTYKGRKVLTKCSDDNCIYLILEDESKI